jgi:hypothetical protein
VVVGEAGSKPIHQSNRPAAIVAMIEELEGRAKATDNGDATEERSAGPTVRMAS